MYRANIKDLRKYLIPGTGCCCPQNKTQKNINFWRHALCKNGFRNKKRKNYFLLLPPPFLEECQNRGMDAVFAPRLVAPPPLSVFHAPFCTLLCFQRMMNQGPGIRESRIVTILDISIRVLMCR